MSTLTRNHPNKTCTVDKIVTWYGQEQRVALTYLNTEQVWPVRSIAIEFVDTLLYQGYQE